jgi:hypothetical protein
MKELKCFRGTRAGGLGVGLRFDKRPHREGQQLIRSISRDDLIRAAPVQAGEFFAESFCGWVWIQPQSAVDRRTDGFQNLDDGG